MQKTPTKRSIKSLDFNCDLAQGYGVYKNNSEYEFLNYVSSVNISCGFHAGDPLTIRKAMLAAKDKNVAIGAHIGYSDIQGFGYRSMELGDDELEALVIYQVGAIMSFAKAYNLEIEHVRPHGAMYKKAAEDFWFASVIARAIQKCSQWLTYCGASGEVIEKVGEYIKIPVSEEIILEKQYNQDLEIEYSLPDIADTEVCMKRLQNILHTSQVNNTSDGLTIANIDSIHFSNKYPNSIEIIQRANSLISPEPVRYGRVKASGWVD
ncbi:MAG: LamB/YcsF family protein [Candidatus Gastranaerophilales bacterium]|nr:LamB/YcsF family protein [Candidatus Gastranaerophilales bacterium]